MNKNNIKARTDFLRAFLPPEKNKKILKWEIKI